LAGLAHEHPEWPRYFLRRDQRTPLVDVGALSFFLRIGYQLAAIFPELFRREQMETAVQQRIPEAYANAEVIGAEVKRWSASPFYQAALRIRQQVVQSNREVAGLRIEQLLMEPLSWPNIPIRSIKATHTVVLWQDHCLRFQGERQVMNSSPLSFVRKTIDALRQSAKHRLRQWTKPDNNGLVLSAATDLTRSKTELVLENMLLRQQLIVLKRQVKRPALTWRDRTLFVLLASQLQTWKQALVIVQPDTVLRWHRDLFLWVWRRKSKSKRGRGKPPLAGDIVALIRQMAKENRTWGAERIRGELLKLGVQVSKNTIQKYMYEVRKPGPSKQTWGTFLRNHASEVWGCDFLQTYDLLFRSLFVFVIIELSTRRLVHFGVTRNPTDAWVAQQLREATPFGEGPRYLIQDNDSKYGRLFERVASGTAIEILRTPYGVPKANAICERFLGSVQRECLDHFLILSERHLHRLVKEYGEYFNRARPHQGLGQRIPCRPPQRAEPSGNKQVVSHPVLVGLHHDYRWRSEERPSYLRAA
jgi:putative transposase